MANGNMEQTVSRIFSSIDEMRDAAAKNTQHICERLTKVETRLDLMPKPPSQPCDELVAHVREHVEQKKKTEERKNKFLDSLTGKLLASLILFVLGAAAFGILNGYMAS